MNGKSKFGWLELIEGILLILFGCYTFIRPDHALTGFIMVLGVVAVIMGIVDILLYVRVERYTGFGPIISLVSGTLSVMSGVMLLIYPDAGKLVMSLLFPMWFIAHCISRISTLNTIRLISGNFTYYSTLILSIIGIILGILMIVNPWFSWQSIRYIISTYLVLQGVDCVVIAISQLGLQK